MKELTKKILDKENELLERIAELEYEIAMYNNDRKCDIIAKCSDEEKAFINYLEEIQDMNCLDDGDISAKYLSDYDTTIDIYIYENIASKINRETIKNYFEYDKHINRK